MTNKSDIVLDILSRISSIVPKEKTDAIERDIRRVWGGDRVYIPIRRDDQAQHSERDRQIRAMYQSGRQIAFIARKYALTERRVQQIIFIAKKVG